MMLQWRSLLTAILLSFLFPHVAWSLSLKLTWNPGQELDLSNYRVYKGNSSGGPYELVGTIMASSSPEFIWQAPDGMDQTVFFVVTAVDESGNESLNSNEVSEKIDLLPPI